MGRKGFVLRSVEERRRTEQLSCLEGLLGPRIKHAQVDESQNEGQNEAACPCEDPSFLLAEAFVHFCEQFAHAFLVV